MGYNMRIKYPRTYHLPWSESVTSDDKKLLNVDHFIDREVIVSEKLDGENTTLYSDYIHARSIDSNNHPSRNWIKKYHSEIKYRIPHDIRICGENLYAEHSIAYDSLQSYFLSFSAWRDQICLDWDTTMELFLSIGLTPVPILYRGVFNIDRIVDCYTGQSTQGGIQEGYIIRLAESFSMDSFDRSVAKWVRKNHVQTDHHWTTKWNINRLA